MTGDKKSLPSFSTAGFFGAQEDLRPYRTQRLPNSPAQEGAQMPEELHDLGDDAADAGAGHTDGARRGSRQVQNAAADEWASVIDGDDDAAVTMGHPQLGAERQRAVGAGQGVLIETLA